MISKENFEKFIKKSLKDRTFFIVTNREPYIHTKTPDGVKVTKTAGGVHTLLDLVAQASNAIYVAHGSGNADKSVVNKHNIVPVPPKTKSYSLKRVFLSKKELENFYYGFSNQTLWPLSHAVFVKPEFHASWWKSYQAVNKKFADAILEEIGDKPAFVWVNDYHLALVPKMLKDSGKNIKVGTFWHIPWATYEIFRVNPWGKEILTGMLGSDFIGFHRGYHVQNFIQCVQRMIEAQIDFDQSHITFKDHISKVESLPAGIDYQEILEIKKEATSTLKKQFNREMGMNIEYLAVGVDRLDYTKGLIERFKMIDRFLEKHPEFQEKFIYYGIMPYSRIHIPVYRNYAKAVTDLCDKINWKYSRNDWEPIQLNLEGMSREKVITYYKNADLCLITPLDDGLNLVAKEYALSCEEESGMIVLSKFAGAANDLRHALLINPYDIEQGADAIYQALIMPSKEKKERNMKMREDLKSKNIYQWAINFIEKTLFE
ncbi:trehalose-6-phosphate synthase [Candidatus Roizmanbacteria bacterium]|nr:trehalose-6-phosphate synthase [Candidatus Roizmanbacteria bacterium]